MTFLVSVTSDTFPFLQTVRPHSYLTWSTGLIMVVPPSQTLAHTPQSRKILPRLSRLIQCLCRTNTLWNQTVRDPDVETFTTISSHLLPTPKLKRFFQTISLAQATSFRRKLPLIKACYEEKLAGTGLRCCWFTTVSSCSHLMFTTFSFENKVVGVFLPNKRC